MKLVEKLLKETGLDEQVVAADDPVAVRSREEPRRRSALDQDRDVRRRGRADLSAATRRSSRRRTRSTSTTCCSRCSSCSTIDEVARARCASRFRHVLVDEFQDTNRVQYDLVRKFAEATRNLTVVGDDDQSIYAWRGAEPRNLLDFDRDFPDATVIKLEQNYRSTQTILDAANGDHPQEPRSPRASRCGPSRAAAIRSRSTRPATSAARRTSSRSRSGALLDDGPCSPSDIAILYRTNAQSRVLEEHLRAARVPAKVVGAVSFFERKEVKDVDRLPAPARQPGGGLGVRARRQRAGARASARPRSTGCGRAARADGIGAARGGAARGARRGRGPRRGAAQEAARVRRADRRACAT